MTLIDTLLKNPGARKATQFVTEKLVSKASRRNKFRRGARIMEFVVTIGAPNYEEREFIRRCKKAGIKLPAKPQLKFYPKK